MRRKALGYGTVATLAVLLILASGLVLAGCTGTAPPAGPGPGGGPVIVTPTVTASTGTRDYMVHVPGRDRGTILLVGRSDCPWCVKEKALLTNMSVGFWWIDINTLNQPQVAEVMASLASVKGCEKISAVPVLVIRGERCIIGYNETLVREVIG